MDAKQILAYAQRAAAAARRHVAEPESSDSGLDTKAGRSTVTRALRACKGVKQRRKMAAASPGQACTAPAPQASDCLQADGEATTSMNGSASACEAAAGHAQSEEERRARKRAKKLAQKQRREAEGTDAERRAKERARRARKKGRLKQQPGTSS